MPRGSKPGERRGGRQRGTPNKATVAKAAALASASADDRKRMRELEFKDIRRCLTLDEQEELDQLTLLYPEPPRESELATAIAELRKKRAP